MSEFDALLQIAALVIGIGAGYAVYSYKATAALKAAARLVTVTQIVRSAKADAIITDAEKMQIGEAVVAFETAVAECATIARQG